MTAPRNNLSYVLAVLAGLLLWGLASLISSRREPWDDGLYWLLVYPLAIAASTLLAYRFPHDAKLLPLVVFESQFLAMALRSAEIGSLWPMGMALFAIMAIPAILIARFIARRSPFLAGAGRRT